MSIEDEYAAAAAALRTGLPVVVATHTNPDGDALGSLVGAWRGLQAAGIAATAVLGPDPVPREYRWLTDGVSATAPAVAEYVLLAVDCGSEQRIALPDGLRERAATVVNIDHHHDNTRFGDVNVVDAGAACATMMVAELLDRLSVRVDEALALPLYVGLVTDTGRFQYSNTDARALRFAAGLIDAGVRPAEVFARVYEGVSAAKLGLLGRALGRLELRVDGRLALTSMTRTDLAETGAEETDGDGVIDHLRSIAGVEVAAVIREPSSGPRYKVSLRSQAGLVDVSAIARSGGGGGHRAAAGFSSDLPLDELVAAIEREAVAGGL